MRQIHSDIKIYYYFRLIHNKNIFFHTYDEKYWQGRFNAEKALYEAFVCKGGKPRIKQPYYFSIGKCDEWFYRQKNCYGSLEFGLEEFETDVVSFTFGTSVPTAMGELQPGNESLGQVYTWAEMSDLIEKSGMFNNENVFSKLGTEKYIEVQIWAEDFYSKLTKKRMLFDHIEVDELATRIIGANSNFPREVFFQESAETLLKECKNHQNWSWFGALVSKTPSIDFSPDFLHGIPHAHKCALLAFVLAMKLDLDTKDFKTLIYTALFHDTGRRCYDNGKAHGVISSERIEAYIESADEVNLELMKDAMAKHEDEPLPSDEDNSFLIWLRDIDSLDYMRLGIAKFNPRFLHCDMIKTMIRFALELNILVNSDSRFVYNVIS